MSLYIGNLSARTRRDELERVFRRFGHCNVQLKREGYGFVVYDFPPYAEKALRALQGRNICGEPLTLTWSNKQPKPFQRFSRGGPTYELQHGRNSDRAGFTRRKVNLNGWRNYKTGNDGRSKSVDIPNEERGYHQADFKDYAGEEKDYAGDFPDDGGGVLPNLEDNGRWGEPIHDPSIDNGNENAVEFDQYEPYHGYDRKRENDNSQIGYSDGSPAENTQENMGRAQTGEETSNHPNHSIYEQTCYRCGESGHKMRNCPKENLLQRKYNRLGDGKDGKIDRKHRAEDDLNKFGSGSWVKRQSSGDASSMRHWRNEGRVSGSRHYQMPLKNRFSPVSKETDQPRRKEYEGKKRSRKEIETPKRSSAKKARRSITSSLPSDHTASCLHSISQSSKSLPRSRSHSRSRSVSYRAHSLSPNLRSSKSHYSRGRSPNSRRSSSRTSLSVSLGQPLPSSPNNVQLNSKGSTINATAPESLDHLVAQGQQIDRNLELENDKSKDTIAVNGNSALYNKAVDDMENDQYVPEDNNEIGILFRASDKVTNSTKARPKGTFAAGNLSPEMMKETGGFQHSGSLILDNIPTEIKKPASDTHTNLASVHSATISSEEMSMVFKHYDLELPKDDEKNLTVDAFFGSARLWPWHIIYYRRLKKGPISTENYARRVAQNHEFGIVDKYIRSSSGWGE